MYWVRQVPIGAAPTIEGLAAKYGANPGFKPVMMSGGGSSSSGGVGQLGAVNLTSGAAKSSSGGGLLRAAPKKFGKYAEAEDLLGLSQAKTGSGFGQFDARANAIGMNQTTAAREAAKVYGLR